MDRAASEGVDAANEIVSCVRSFNQERMSLCVAILRSDNPLHTRFREVIQGVNASYDTLDVRGTIRNVHCDVCLGKVLHGVILASSTSERSMHCDHANVFLAFHRVRYYEQCLVKRFLAWRRDQSWILPSTDPSPLHLRKFCADPSQMQQLTLAYHNAITTLRNTYSLV